MIQRLQSQRPASIKVKLSTAVDVDHPAREQLVENISAGTQHLNRLGVHGGPAPLMLTMPCLVGADDISDIADGGHTEPHLHVVGVRQITLPPHTIHYARPHDHLRSRDRVGGIATTGREPGSTFPNGPRPYRLARGRKAITGEVDREPVHEADTWKLLQDRDRAAKGPRGEQIVGIETNNVLAVYCCQPRVEGLHRAAVDAVHQHSNSVIPLGQASGNRHALVGRRIVDDDNLDLHTILRQNAVHGLT